MNNLGDVDEERKDWLNLFEEIQIQPDLALKRSARFEKRTFELQSIQEEQQKIQQSIQDSHSSLTQIIQENERLKG